MKRVAVALGAVAALVATFYLSQLLASESGEVVVLTTKDAAGEPVQTRVWIVEYDGDLWLRIGQPGSAWHQRLADDPKVEVVRGGVTRPYHAEPRQDRRDAINDLMREKYLWADWYIDALFDASDALPIRLIPR